MNKIKLKKTLYVGLGGTGVSTLLRVKKCFIDSYGEIPPMIGFLAIDTDTSAYNKEITSNLNKKIKLEQNELLVCTVKRALDTYKNNPREFDWVPANNVSKLSSISGQGAGQVRSNGRFIAYYNYKQIENSIKSVVTKINQLIPETSPYMVDTNKNGIEFPITVNIFSSVAGGTGGGMIVDVLCLINKAIDSLSLQFDLFPWLVLPEIFKAMNTGPAMANVSYNAYGTLRTLDYIEHLDPKQPVINFGYTKINERLFRYAYLINNYNQAGVAFNKIDDLLDVIAKSAFLPANRMGDDLTSPFDNIKNQQDGGVYDIKDKKAWVASSGSAELLYDSQAVGCATAYRIISQLCNSMLGGSHDGTQYANNFVDHQDVLMRENNGRNDVIDALLNPAPEYTLNVDETTQTTDIESCIDYNAGQRIQETLSKAMNAKLSAVKAQFDEQVANLLDNTNSGCLSLTKAFISALRTIIGLCNAEMKEEQENFNALNTQPTQWESYINQLPKGGLAKIFGGAKYNEEAAETLTQVLTERITNLREEQRRLWAIRFYNALDEYVASVETQLTNLSNYISHVQEEYRDKLLLQQQLSSSTSKFQIFLHKNDVNALGMYTVDEATKASFHQHFKSRGGIISWLSLSKQQISEQLFTFAKDTTAVRNAVNVTIDDILRNMRPEEVEKYIEQLKVLAAPLWSHNTQGYKSAAHTLDQFAIVGVGNRDTSYINNDPQFSKSFDLGTNPASFASTNQNDRIYLLIVEDLLPVYAVNNFSTYESEYNQKIASGVKLDCYIDEKLNNRINSENFRLLPTIEQDNILQLWVYAFIFGYIHFDTETGQYWIKSNKRGSAIHQFRFDLGTQRDVAYDIFKSEGLYKEIEENMNRRISHEGNDVIKNKIDEIKQAGNYLTDYAQLSPIEQSQLEEPKFKSVLSLVEQECKLMSPEY
ncbi:MAG: tubulin-like doman-containing protein [Paludibacteraceae bacterium]